MAVVTKGGAERAFDDVCMHGMGYKYQQYSGR